MEPEKTILQQIREKEQDYAEKLDGIRKETDAAIAAARKEAEDLICTAESAGKKAAEQVYWDEKGRTEMEMAEIKKQAVLERESAVKRGEKNLERTARKISAYVISE